MVVATVIGGAGRMGGWFASFLKENGYRIIICDKNRKPHADSRERKDSSSLKTREQPFNEHR